MFYCVMSLNHGNGLEWQYFGIRDYCLHLEIEAKNLSQIQFSFGNKISIVVGFVFYSGLSSSEL